MVHPLDSDEAVTRKPNMREAILSAAEELFSTKGFDAVSVRDIAQAAGANPGITSRPRTGCFWTFTAGIAAR
jgi:Bacterial regulatory proteins, tetR family